MGDLPAEVDGGLIVRNDQGNPTGTLTILSSRGNVLIGNTQGIFVDNAMELIPIPAWTEEVRAKFFDITMKDALSVGLTSIHDADSSPEAIMLFKKSAFQHLFCSFTNFSQM
jgi:predicted amidohydrolase YtcJ